MFSVLDDAFEKKYAVPQFNMNGTIWLDTILKTAEECQAPVIVGTTDRIIEELGGFKLLVQTFNTKKEELKITVPAILHLDHGQSIESCFRAIDAGYDSVMFDGSNLSIEENIEKTKKVVDYAKEKEVTVEGEVGSVGGTEDGVYSDMLYADIDECLRLVNETGINSLAPALGSVHGKYRGEPNLGFNEMKDLRKTTSVPFVLHGASGISNEDLKKAISYGHAKINYNTELNIAWSNALRKVLNENPELYAPMEIIKPSKEAMAEVIKNIFKRTGAYQKKK
ncbi:ketose-bisphosphate aldolase [Salinicoccus roseus]|uniref:class II fructose-bisphosphate aldolase n=1 Tax=Salinicoccus roseus TaxID=45670 RepID=UPI001CA6D0CB|nr:ketose-bisphosphate aldolase [Salinicoccus roseus]MBY8909173.1 ketose-bisphosphate aldolase [Salinicoccus roseus]